MKLEDLQKQIGVQPPAVPAKDAPHPMSLPWWVVVLSKKPNPDGTPRFKFDFGYDTKEEAEERCKERQDAANIEAVARNERNVQHAINQKLPADWTEIVEPFQFFVIERPVGAHL